MTDSAYKLSPSDFAYLYEECKFCYYQKVKFGISPSSVFPSMFGRINKILQDSIMGKNIQDIIPHLPSGIITVQEGFIKSSVVPGTSVFLSGRFDILTRQDDGTYSLIDFKITQPEEEKILKKYTSQLHAYKYALENPLNNERVKVSAMGVVCIDPKEMEQIDDEIIFKTTPSYFPVEENMDNFLTLMKDISEFLNGPTPEESTTCKTCIYRSRMIAANTPTEDSIPF